MFTKNRNSQKSPDTTEKLQKVLARAGLGSRREIETWIEKGRVQVNRKIATIGVQGYLAPRITFWGMLLHHFPIMTVAKMNLTVNLENFMRK